VEPVQGYAISDPWTRADPPAWALSEVRVRRALAILLDVLLIGALFLLFLFFLLLIGLVTFGLSWALLPALYPIVALAYNGFSISGWRMATPGMRALDLEVRLCDGTRPPFLNAAAHALFFYLTWVFLTPLILLISFISRDKRCLHDMLAGVIVTRRI
jgi:uncharacterized RDD family membrane protein YckC